jgi:nucleoside transporter
MTLQMKTRLGVMMFLQYFVWGAWYVTLGTWLATSLHYSGQQIGWAAGTTAIGAIVSPFFVGLVADRLFATQRVLCALYLLGAVLLYIVSMQLRFAPLYAFLLLYSLCYMPTLSLTNALAFRQMRDPGQEFGLIRMLGTGGWIVAGLIVGGLRLEATAVPMRLAALSSLVMAVYCLTLPDTPPLARALAQGSPSLFPKEALQLFRNKSMAVFAIASFLICVPLQFYYAFTNLFLNEVGVVNAAGKMTGGQMSELIGMLLIPWFFRRLGVKYMLAVGMLAWVVRYACFALGDSHQLMWMLWIGIVLHGICYDFFFVTGQIYIDREAPAGLRSATQGIITLITYGLGMFVGSLLSGGVVSAYSTVTSAGTAVHDWRSIWIISGLCSAAVLAFFLISFRDDAGRRNVARSTALPQRSNAIGSGASP